MSYGFDFFVGGLENAMLALLRDGDGVRSGVRDAYDKKPKIETYAGELDRDDFVQAVKELASRFPLIMLSYGSGTSKRKAATSLLDGDPIEMEHSCGFVLIICSADQRSHEKRRSEVYGMLAQAQDLLGGVQFLTTVNAGTEEETQVALNTQPLIPGAVECIARLPELTAYALHFDTSFHFWTPDRRTIAVGNADEIDLSIDPDNPPASTPSGLPGVQIGEQ